MKIVTWNLNHRAGRNKVQPGDIRKVAGALVSLDTDIVVLTEYVPDPTYDSQFQKDLKLSGFSEVLISDHYGPEKGVHNRILIASRIPMKKGAIKAPTDIIDAVPNNIFHVTVPELNLNILGLRMPLPMKAEKKKDWWDWVTAVAEENRNHPFIILGDFNTDVSTRGPNGGIRFTKITEDGWQRVSPSGQSYWSQDLTTQSRLDHALFTRHFVIKTADYKISNKDFVFTKTPMTDTPEAISDHAVLQVEFDLLKK
jgi:endonuclease/exonuclease/phosphatase family metal-dependent hydrolase